jgi:hypothetical protein
MTNYCPCGCGVILHLWGGRPVRWAMSGCRQRAWRLCQREKGLGTWEWTQYRKGACV